MTLDLFFKIARFNELLALVAVLMVLVFFNQRSATVKLVGIYFTFSLVNFLILSFASLKGKEVNIPQSFCAILQFFTLCVIYYINLGKRYHKYFLMAGTSYFIFAIINMLSIQKLNINTYTMVVSSFIVLAYCVGYWYRLLVDLPVQNLNRVPMFWFNSAFLFFSAGALFLHLFTPYLVEVLHNDLLIYWTFHNILLGIQTLIVIVGLCQDLRNIKSRSSLPLAQ